MTFLFRQTGDGAIADIDGNELYVGEAVYTVASVGPAVPPPPGLRCRCCGRRAPATPSAQPGIWDAEVERTEGKFQSRDDVWAELESQLGTEVEEVDRPEYSEPCALCSRLAPPPPPPPVVTMQWSTTTGSLKVFCNGELECTYCLGGGVENLRTRAQAAGVSVEEQAKAEVLDDVIAEKGGAR